MSAWLRLGKALDRAGGLLVAGSVYLLLAMVALIGVEIVARAVFKTSTQIADEYAGYLFSWITLCSFLYAQRTDRFLRVDSLRNRLSPRARAGADALASLLGVGLIAVLLHATWGTVDVSIAFNTTSLQPSQTPLYLPQLIMPVGFVLLMAGFLQTSVVKLLQALGHLPITSAAASDPLDAE